MWTTNEYKLLHNAMYVDGVDIYIYIYPYYVILGPKVKNFIKSLSCGLKYFYDGEKGGGVVLYKQMI